MGDGPQRKPSRDDEWPDLRLRKARNAWSLKRKKLAGSPHSRLDVSRPKRPRTNNLSTFLGSDEVLVGHHRNGGVRYETSDVTLRTGREAIVGGERSEHGFRAVAYVMYAAELATQGLNGLDPSRRNGTPRVRPSQETTCPPRRAERPTARRLSPLISLKLTARPVTVGLKMLIGKVGRGGSEHFCSGVVLKVRRNELAWSTVM